MTSTVRYGEYLRAIGAGRREVSYNAIMPPARRDELGRPGPVTWRFPVDRDER